MLITMLEHYAWIFFTGYVAVFAAGFQSRNVNTGNYPMAALTSMIIAIMSVGIWRATTDPNAGWSEILVYGLSGACGITSSMWVHDRLFFREFKG